MLDDGLVAARLPVQDLERARAFYSEKLGLEPCRPGWCATLLPARRLSS
jgi:extradiol dioxygenase family protein